MTRRRHPGTTAATSIRFVARTKLWVTISAVLVAVSVAALVAGGLNLSIEFVGGTAVRLEGVDADTSSDTLRDAATGVGLADVVAQIQTDSDGNATSALVRTEALTPGSDQAVTLRETLVAVSGAAEVSESFVGPTWGAAVTRQAALALAVFLVLAGIYITVRLEAKMAAIALVALAHDLTITVGLYALTSFNVSPATIIALLTILGYSLYDTFVVFDRVQEVANDPTGPRRTVAQATDLALDQVTWRSVSTSITSLVPVGVLLVLGSQLLGADTLMDLALALFIGMAVGIYSSLFIAGPLYATWQMRDPAQQRLAARIAKNAAGADGLAADTEPEPELAAGAPITSRYVRGEQRRTRRQRRR